MNKFPKILTIVILLSVSVITVSNAQTKTEPYRLGVGLNLGAANSTGYNVTLGGDLKLQKDITKVISASLATGYTNFFPNKNKGFTQNFGFVPLKAGIKFFPVSGVYLGGELGAAFGVEKNSGTSFLYAPAVGITFNKNYDLSARYEALNRNNVTLSHIALRLAYAFTL